MPYDIQYMPIALEQLRSLTAREQRMVVDTVEEQLRHQADVPTSNRKRMRPNKLAAWELRIGDLRVFYEIETPGGNRGTLPDPVVVVLAVGIKKGNRLWIGNEEYEP